MGSVTAIFLVPFLSVFAIFIGFFEMLTGVGTEKVVLPYDPENGIVWEYNQGEEAFVDCIKSEIKNGQQIFTFRGKAIFDAGRPSSYEHDNVVDDICFEDENGNIKMYYAFIDFRGDAPGDPIVYGSVDIYEETECVTFEYTVTAQQEVEDCYWLAYDYDASMRQNRYIGECELKDAYERTYKFVFSPEDIKDHIFDMSFYYRTQPGKQYEKIGVTFEMKDKEVRLIEEIFYVEDENGVWVKPQ